MDMRGVGCAFETTRINNRLGANVERSFGLPLDAGCRARVAEDATRFFVSTCGWWQREVTRVVLVTQWGGHCFFLD